MPASRGCISPGNIGELANYSNVFPVPVFFNIYAHERDTLAEARHKAFEGMANGVYPNFWSTPGMKPVFAFCAGKRNTTTSPARGR